MDSLKGLPSLGSELCRCLVAAGISSPSDLRRLGSIEAAIRISRFRPAGSSCRIALCALEGAIRGMRWHAIAKAARDELWEEYERRSGGHGDHVTWSPP